MMDSHIVRNNNEFKKNAKTKRVYIYGCGIYGRTLFFFMRENFISDILGFVVTERGNEKEILYRKVYPLEDYAKFADNECLLVIGVSGKYRDDVIGNAKDKGIKNVITISDGYWNYILRSTAFFDTEPVNNIAILMYHRVDDNTEDFWKLNVSKEVFEKHISYISSNYDVLKLDDDWSVKVDPKKKYVVLTFDDGYADNFIEALPILEKYKVPATFFVPTDLIGTNEMFWWDELEELLVTSEYNGSFQYDGKEYLVKDKGDRERLCWRIRNSLRGMTSDAIKERIDSIRKQFKRVKKTTERLRCLNFEEISRLSESEFATIGGHTKSHLSMGEGRTRDLMVDEVGGSLDILRKATNGEINTFAFPFGGDEDHCTLAEEVLKENGIKRAVIVKSGNVGALSDGYTLPRHMMFNDDDIESKLNRIWGIYG